MEELLICAQPKLSRNLFGHAGLANVLKYLIEIKIFERV
jgi:hypothetical protein